MRIAASSATVMDPTKSLSSLPLWKWIWGIEATLFTLARVCSTSRIYSRESRMDCRCTFVALGGGVIGDMCGFAAATYVRGVNFIQIPTTLMAQVDSSVGGKTGVNHPQGKNMIGAFYQPQCVLIDTDTLNTLPDRELASGISEVIKYGLIRDAKFFEWQEKNIEALLASENKIKPGAKGSSSTFAKEDVDLSTTSCSRPNFQLHLPR